MITLLRRQTGAGLSILLVVTVLRGMAYPLVVWGVRNWPGLQTGPRASSSPRPAALQPGRR